MCGMTAIVRSFRREPYPARRDPHADRRGGAACRRVRARRQKIQQKLERQHASRRVFATMRCLGVAAPVKCGCRPIRKSGSGSPNKNARGQFPGAGPKRSCHDEDMPVICPTCQMSLESPSIARRRFYSNPCTGGAVFAAMTGGAAFAVPVSTGLATGNGFVLAAACCRVPASGVRGPACVTRRPRARECPTPQECAIAGPALYPMNAPATAPTGPSTIAPDTAPNAALPARS